MTPDGSIFRLKPLHFRLKPHYSRSKRQFPPLNAQKRPVTPKFPDPPNYPFWVAAYPLWVSPARVAAKMMPWVASNTLGPPVTPQKASGAARWIPARETAAPTAFGANR